MSELFTTARCKLVLDHPFFAVLALHMKEVVMDMKNPLIQALTMPTCGVDGERLMINPEWVSKLSEKEKIGLLCHEVMHVALGHVFPWRRKWRDRKRWNVAGDYVINAMIKNDGLTLPEGGLYNKKYDGMSTEEVYETLEDKDCPKNPWEDVFEAGSLGGDASGAKPTPAQMKEIEQQVKELLVQATHVARLRGRLPHGMERLVDDIVNPSIPWYQLLERYVNEILRDDYNELYHDRRYIQSGIYLPDLYSEGSKIVVAIDTSGSIGKEEINLFVSETVGILRSRNVSEVRLIACDAAITLDTVIHAWDSLPEDFPGGGGTSFVPVFDLVAESSERPACLIYLTDTYGGFPSEQPPYPVIWATMEDEERAKVPWGLRVVFDPKDSTVLISEGTDSDVDYDN